MFRALLRPSSEQDCVLPHIVFRTGCADYGRVESAQLVLNSICGDTQSCSPDIVRNNAGKMLR